MRPRYYCDFCDKGNGSPSAMKRHERGCTLNPQRVCGMCKMIADSGGPEPAPPRDDLVRVMDEHGFVSMCELAHGCPACILSAVRTKNHNGDGELPPGVLGPEAFDAVPFLDLLTEYGSPWELQERTPTTAV